MQHDKKYLEKLINEYLHGTITPEEKKHLERWVERLDISDEQPAPNEFHKMLMKKQIDLRTGGLENTVRQPKRKLWWPAVAASLLCVLGIGTYLWQSNQVSLENRQALVINQTSDLFEVTNSSDRDTLLSLKDGSQVLLSSESTLTGPINFASDARRLTLEGKAFFRVARDIDRPFSVHAGNIITTALGTSFWIDKKEGDLSPLIKLVTGKISITQRMPNGQDSLLTMLTPGQEWRAAKPHPASMPHTDNNRVQKQKSASKKPELIFHHTPLDEVFPRLATYYGITIQFDSEDLRGMSFYGTYDTDNHIQEILQTIALANDLTVTYNEKETAYSIKK